MRKVALTCAFCGSEFVHEALHAGRFPRYCVTACRKAANRHSASLSKRNSYAKRRAEGMPAKKSGKTHPCTSCGARMDKKNTSAQSPKCRKCRKAERIRPCVECGREFEAPVHNRDQARCEKHRQPNAKRWPTARDRISAKTHARRAKLRGIESEPYSLNLVAERDGNACGICGQEVDVTLSGLHREGPNIDHRLPLARGGDDTFSNVQLAHRRCNLSKGVS